MLDTLADILTVDVRYRGQRRYIACCLLPGPDPVIVDPGPEVSLAALEAGLAAAGVTVDDLAGVLLTHIHLDHAGATGTLVARNPALQVWVHERGARHMTRPERLLRSAERLYGDRMAELWGEFRTVPEDNVRPLAGGEVLELAGRRIEVAYTPGHAIHHVSYLDTATGTAFVGDTTGIRVDNHPFVLPVTPPPDVDLQAWDASLQTIAEWQPERLFVTHFGVADGVEGHIEEFRHRLHSWAAEVRAGLEGPLDDDQCIAAFSAEVVAELQRRLPPDVAPLYRQGGAPDLSWHGLARYWRKTTEAVG